MSMTLHSIFEWLYYSAQWWEPFLIDGTAIVLAGSAVGIGISLRRIAIGWRPKKKQKPSLQGEQTSQKDLKKQKRPEKKEKSFQWEDEKSSGEAVSQVAEPEELPDGNPSTEPGKEQSTFGEQANEKAPRSALIRRLERREKTPKPGRDLSSTAPEAEQSSKSQ
ncbi:MAG: hypothetical protein M1587_03900 [Thaumarchaeota archaeon]|nr:hypothetical protein [Nitrososphaerota archaeon]